MDKKGIVKVLFVVFAVTLLGWFIFSAESSTNSDSNSSLPSNSIQVSKDAYQNQKGQIEELKKKIAKKEEEYRLKIERLTQENDKIEAKIKQIEKENTDATNSTTSDPNPYIDRLLKEKKAAEDLIASRQKEYTDLKAKQDAFFKNLTESLPKAEADKVREERDYQEKYARIMNTEQGMWRRVTRTLETERQRVEDENKVLEALLARWKVLKAEGKEIPIEEYVGNEWNGGMTREVEYNRDYVRPEPGYPSTPGSDRRLAVCFIPMEAELETHRGRIRVSYRMDMPPDVDYYFMIPTPKDSFILEAVTTEARAWGDILFLDTDPADATKDTFNMLNEYFGKTSDFSVRYDFVARIDYHSFLLFPMFGDYFATLPKENAFFGKIEDNSMSKIGYGMSWDVFERAASEQGRGELNGDERIFKIIEGFLPIGSWMNDARVSASPEVAKNEQIATYVKYGEDWYDVITQNGWSKNKEFQTWYKEYFLKGL